MKVDVVATHEHYLDHLRPIFAALPDEVKGTIHRMKPRRFSSAPADLTLVAGKVDFEMMRPSPCVYVEHGVGQTYLGLEGSHHHPGARHPAHVVGYISPSQLVADSWHGRPAVAVGCPKLDRLLLDGTAPEPRTLAVTWRWNPPIARLCPEQRSARAHYLDGMRDLIDGWRAQGWTVLGHGHPRARHELEVYWRNLGIRPTWDSFEVLERANLVIGDNSSFLYEAAALKRHVLCLNAPWYRRDVEHGLRFWTNMPGGDVDSLEQLADLNLAAYVDNGWGELRRRSAVVLAYAYTDGSSSRRAAEFVVGLLEQDVRALSRSARTARRA